MGELLSTTFSQYTMCYLQGHGGFAWSDLGIQDEDAIKDLQSLRMIVM